MRRSSRSMMYAGVLNFGGISGAGFAQAPAAVPRPATAATSPTTPAPARAPASASLAAYWGSAPPVATKKKPNAVRRMFNRVGAFLGADEEMGTMPTYRDPATGRTNTGASKPFLKQSDQ